jgi:hypothetical protein
LTALSVSAALRSRFGQAALWAALAVLVKGPFGLLPLACISLGLGPRALWRGALACLAAIVPAAIFLLHDRAGSGSWWHGYVEQQLLASASGARLDGVVAWWFPLAVIAGRFWPGLPFAVYGALRRQKAARALAIACVAIAALLCLPHRKWGNHTYVAFPLFAMLAGIGLAPLLERLPLRRTVATLGAAAALAWVLSLAGVGRLVLRPPCVVHASELAPPLSALARGTHILIVAEKVDWLLTGELAQERGLVPWPQSRMPEAALAHYALVQGEAVAPEPWRELGRARGWALYRRQ